MTNICRIKACEVIMWEYICIGFINFKFKDKNLTVFKNLFLQKSIKKSDKVFLKLSFKIKLVQKWITHLWN